MKKEEKKGILEKDPRYPLIESKTINGILYEVYLDDYGQSYFIKWLDPKTHEISEAGCGTYCGYEDTLEYLVEIHTKKKMKGE